MGAASSGRTLAGCSMAHFTGFCAGRATLTSGAAPAAGAVAPEGAGAFLFLSASRPLAATDLPQHVADAKNGERLYHAAGCISCHKAAKDVAGADGLPAGGMPFKTPVGTFYPPNLTPDAETGIGDMTDVQFVNAVQRGISPEGENLIPAFPYTSYARMKTEDVLDIRAYLASLPPVVSPEKPADMPAPPSFRKVNPADQPVLRLVLSSPTLKLSDLDEYAETMLAQRISMISGVAQVQVYGSQKYAVRAQLDPRELATRGIGVDEVVTAMDFAAGLPENMPAEERVRAILQRGGAKGAGQSPAPAANP